MIRAISQSIKHYQTFMAVMALSVALAFSPSTQAQLYNSPAGSGSSTIAPQTCDPDYWQSMSSKAWMEAEREIIQNKNLIFKPDSVLEYTCFDSFLQHTAKYGGNIFVHTQYFGKEIIPRGSKYSMENALQNTVTKALKTYISSNFNHKFLGGRSEHLDMVKDRTLGDATAMADYSCNILAEVWKGAKCINFIDNDKFKLDGFFPFDDLNPGPGSNLQIKGYTSIDDPRQFPDPCAKWTKWQETVDKSANKEDVLYDFHKPLKDTYDDIRPKLKAGSCEPAIPTGVMVITSASKKGYKDGICSNPGCSYVEEGKCE